MIGYNIDVTENALILRITDSESTLPFSTQYIISDKPGLWSYTALTEKINANSDKYAMQLNKTTGKITLTVKSNYAIIFSSKLASMLGISNANVLAGGLTYYPGLILTLMKFTAGTYESATAIN